MSTNRQPRGSGGCCGLQHAPGPDTKAAPPASHHRACRNPPPARQQLEPLLSSNTPPLYACLLHCSTWWASSGHTPPRAAPLPTPAASTARPSISWSSGTPASATPPPRPTTPRRTRLSRCASQPQTEVAESAVCCAVRVHGWQSLVSQVVLPPRPHPTTHALNTTPSTQNKQT